MGSFLEVLKWCPGAYLNYSLDLLAIFAISNICEASEELSLAYLPKYLVQVKVTVIHPLACNLH